MSSLRLRSGSLADCLLASDITTSLFIETQLVRDSAVPSTEVASDTAVSASTSASGSTTSVSSLGKRPHSDSGSTTDVSSASHSSRNVKPKLSKDPADPFFIDDSPAGETVPPEEAHRIPVVIVRLLDALTLSQFEFSIKAHSSFHQNRFNSKNLAWGVQWEISRLISIQRMDYGDIVLEKLDELSGSNVDAAPKVARVLLLNNDLSEASQYDRAFEREIASRVSLLFMPSIS